LTGANGPPPSAAVALGGVWDRSGGTCCSWRSRRYSCSTSLISHFVGHQFIPCELRQPSRPLGICIRARLQPCRTDSQMIWALAPATLSGALQFAEKLGWSLVRVVRRFSTASKSSIFVITSRRTGPPTSATFALVGVKFSRRGICCSPVFGKLFSGVAIRLSRNPPCLRVPVVITPFATCDRPAQSLRTTPRTTRNLRSTPDPDDRDDAVPPAAGAASAQSSREDCPRPRQSSV
jgi:hypothetical protein